MYTDCVFNEGYHVSFNDILRQDIVSEYLVYPIYPKYSERNTWPRGYKHFFMLNSAEHEICHANKSQITNNCKFFLANHR